MVLAQQQGDDDSEERRYDDYINEGANQLTTIYELWLRPWTYYAIGNSEHETVKMLQKDFPRGAKVTLVGDMVVRVEEAKLDDEWVVLQNPLSENLVGESLGKSVISVQNLTNETNDLTLKVISHSIPTNFADPTVVSLESIARHGGEVGVIHPAKSKNPDKSLKDSFHSTERSTLSREVDAYSRYMHPLP